MSFWFDRNAWLTFLVLCVYCLTMALISTRSHTDRINLQVFSLVHCCCCLDITNPPRPCVLVPYNIGCFEFRSIAKAIPCIQSNCRNVVPWFYIFNLSDANRITHTHTRTHPQCSSHNETTSKSFIRLNHKQSQWHTTYTGIIIEFNPYMNSLLTLYACIDVWLLSFDTFFCSIYGVTVAIEPSIRRCK